MAQQAANGQQLENVTIGQLLEFKEKARPGGYAVVTLEHDQSVASALKVLAKHKITSAPLVLSASLEDMEGGGEAVAAVDETPGPTLLGWVDINDILKALLNHVKQQHPNLPHNMLLLMSLLEAAGKSFNTRTLVTLTGSEDRGLMYETEEGASLLRTIKESLLNNAGVPGRVVHRLAVFDAHGEVQHVVSQLDIIRYLVHKPSLLGGLATTPLQGLALLPSGPGHVVCVDAHVPTLLALDRMVAVGVRGAAVLSPTGELVANLSTSDLRGIQPEHLSVLALPVAEFLALLHGTSYLGYSQRGSEQASHPFFAAGRRLAPEGVEGVGAHGGDEDTVRLITCKRETTLLDALKLMVDNHVHRVYAVDPEARPQVVAVVTPTDVLKWLVATPGAQASTGAAPAAAT